jgi:hypothetical protein
MTPERDHIGVATYALSDRIEFLWLQDGDHDLTARKKLSGFSAADHLTRLASTAHDWANRLLRQ